MRAASLVLFPALGLVFMLLSLPGALGDPPRDKKAPDQKVVLVIHGGAGVLDEDDLKELRLSKDEHRKRYEGALADALEAGYRVLQQPKKTSVDAVEAAIRFMEDAGVFNAGRGAVFNHDGRVELDAGIMEGKTRVEKGGEREGKHDPRKRAGAVAGVSHINHPISAARAVMEAQRQVLLAGEGAESFALGEKIKEKYHIEKVSTVYFWTDRRLKEIRKKIEEEEKKGGAKGPGHGTVGAAALDRQGNLAAGTSTGGLSNKHPGRIGDSPIIGAGTYADDRACAVSCTGTGEVFIRHAVAHDVVARMLYAKDSVQKAASDAIAQLPDEKDGVGGLIALDRDGNHYFAMSARSLGMYRGYATSEGEIYVAIYKDDNPKLMKKVDGGK
jgi:beta-aspartyl-peptidase (threonine type)